MKLLASALVLVLAVSGAAFAAEPSVEGDSPADPSPTPSSDPAPYVAPPPGIYYVTETYVSDFVTRDGLLTTYGTATVQQSTGTYARVLETVATGTSSVYDGAAFNGRRTLSDGRSVAGTYYENFVLTDAGFVPVSIVFFQDDAELARLARGASTPAPSPTPALSATPTSNPSVTSDPCCASVSATPRPAASRAGQTPRPIRPVVSLRRATAPLKRIEVLRGRTVSLWPRAFVDEREIAIDSWTVVAGVVGDAVTTSGSGSAPFLTSWTELAPPGAAHTLVFRITVDTPEMGRRAVDATIEVVVRSPALEP